MRLKRKEQILFFERLHMLLEAGLTIVESLKTLDEKKSSKRRKLIFASIITDVESGGVLSRALSNYIHLSPTIIGVLRHGEVSGRTVDSCKIAQSIIERQDELIKSVTSALVYPSVIGICAAILTIGLFKGVMPQITPMLHSLNVELPIITRIVIFISEHITTIGLYSLGCGVVIGLVGLYLYRKLETFRLAVHICAGKLPLIENLVHQYSVTLFLRSCGSLIYSGLPVNIAYASASGSVSYLPLKKRALSKCSEVDQGQQLSHVCEGFRMPHYVISLIDAGQRSGILGSSMLRAADIIDRELTASLKKITSLIEPLMMVAMGGGIGLVAVSIMMPIYDLSKVLQK